MKTKKKRVISDVFFFILSRNFYPLHMTSEFYALYKYQDVTNKISLTSVTADCSLPKPSETLLNFRGTTLLNFSASQEKKPCNQFNEIVWIVEQGAAAEWNEQRTKGSCGDSWSTNWKLWRVMIAYNLIDTTHKLYRCSYACASRCVSICVFLHKYVCAFMNISISYVCICVLLSIRVCMLLYLCVLRICTFDCVYEQQDRNIIIIKMCTFLIIICTCSYVYVCMYVWGFPYVDVCICVFVIVLYTHKALYVCARACLSVFNSGKLKTWNSCVDNRYWPILIPKKSYRIWFNQEKNYNAYLNFKDERKISRKHAINYTRFIPNVMTPKMWF